MDFQSAWSITEHKLCARCRRLDLLATLNSSPPWKSQSELVKAFEGGHESIQNLGTAGSVQFWTDCSVCRCLFAMTPNPSSAEQEILLFPDWTMSRLAGEDGVAIDSKMKSRSATCVVIVLKPSTVGLPLPIIAHRGDALCLIEEDLDPSRYLGGRRIEQGLVHVGSGDGLGISGRLELARTWINACSTRHGTACAPVVTEEMDQVRLLDVDSRKIVSFLKGGANYVALSYVWGPITQQSFDLGDDLSKVKLPKTIEDAIWFVKRLGQQYLWVDSICINQRNKLDKANQIERMWSIYLGSVVTLLALSGDSAYDGIPKLGRTMNFAQITCCIDGKRLVGLMPTLSQHIWLCPWGQRAWTLQEAILSPRCLYFSDHQMHFECKAMQCCESLDESKSRSHELTAASKPRDVSFAMWMADQMGPGCLRIDAHGGRIDHYGRKLTLYTYRDMTDPSDSLNAFKGVLQKMTELYPKGWYEGLPVEDFDWALLWRHQHPARRREGFPSWTWAGWKGRIWHGQPIEVTKPRRFPIHLLIHKAVNNELVCIFESNARRSADVQEAYISILNDPVDKSWQRGPVEHGFSIDADRTAEESRCLFVEAIIVECALDFSLPLQWTRTSGNEALFSFPINGVECVIGIMALDLEITYKPAVELRTLVLIARDHVEGFIIHHLLLVREPKDGRGFERVTKIQLFVPLNHLEVLEQLRPQRRRLVIT